MKLLYCLLLCCLPLLLSGCEGVNAMFYYPDREVYDTPDRHGLKFEEVTFASRDGTRLSGWFVPAVGTAQGTVVHFHGNAQNMTAHFGFVAWLPARGFNLFVFDYRGYGKSAGRAERQGIFEDCLAALDYIEQRPGLARDRLLLLGQSLGGANAIAAFGSAPRRSVRGLVSDSAFASYQGIVGDKLVGGSLPVLLRNPLSRLLISDRLSPEAYVAKIAPTPLVIIHGTADDIIPYGHGQRLFELARQPKQFWAVEGGGHISALDDNAYRQRLVEFFRAALVQPEPSTGEGDKNR